MKLLLCGINAKYIHSNPAIYSLKAYTEAYATLERLQIELAEYTINQELDFILEDIYKKRPDILAISCYIWNIHYVKLLVKDIAKVLPQTKIWLGGPEVTYDGVQALQTMPEVTGIILGEGEKIFLEVCKYYDTEVGELRDIAGIVYRKEDGEIVTTRVQTDFLDLSTVPFLYDDLAPFENRIIYYETSRGCPFSCSYCLSSVDKRVRFRDVEIVKKEISFFLEKKVAQVKLVDRTFNCKKSHCLAIWQHILENDNGVTNFHFEVSADLIGQEELAILKQMRPGLVQLEIGVQTTNPVTAKEIRRNASFESITRVVKTVNTFHNIHQHLDLIIGLPFENYNSFANSFNEVYALEPEQLQVGFLKVLKGSYMHQMAETYGIVYRERAPYEVLYTRWVSYEELLRLKALEEVVEVYYNSGQFKYTLRYLQTQFKTPFHMYEALADYYEEHNLFAYSHSRMKRYELLLDFALQHHKTEEVLDKYDIYTSLLTYDYYLREHAKSRLSFSRDLSTYKEHIKTFYIYEDKNLLYLTAYETVTSKQRMNMTHIEYLPFDISSVWEKQIIEKKEHWALFTYKDRDALNHDGIVYDISQAMERVIKKDSSV